MIDFATLAPGTALVCNAGASYETSATFVGLTDDGRIAIQPTRGHIREKYTKCRYYKPGSKLLADYTLTTTTTHKENA